MPALRLFNSSSMPRIHGMQEQAGIISMATMHTETIKKCDREAIEPGQQSLGCGSDSGDCSAFISVHLLRTRPR